MHVQSTACLDEKRLCSGTSLWVLFPGPPRLGTRILIFNRLCHWEYTQFLLYNAHRQALELCDNSCTHCDLQNVKSTRTCCIAHGTLLNVMWQPGWKGIWERMDIWICVAESPCCPSETTTTLLIGYERETESCSVMSNSLGTHRLYSSVGKESASNAGDLGSIPGSGRSAGEGIGCPLQYSGLENTMDCRVYGVAESDMTEWLSLHRGIEQRFASKGEHNAFEEVKVTQTD